jgi:hypothetical protein
MVHSGYEATAVDQTFGSLRGFLATVRATLLGYRWSGDDAIENSDGAADRDGAVEPPVVEKTEVASCGAARTGTKA